jgi:hyperosmotically inducible protein
MHQHRFHGIILAVAAVGLLIAPTVTSAGQAPDNTKINAQDRSKDAKTADQQKDNATDRELTRSIRRALTQDKDLSSYGHNVKIITQGGHVTLKGPVRTEDEKRVIEMKAIEVAGAGHVTNEISIAKQKR